MLKKKKLLYKSNTLLLIEPLKIKVLQELQVHKMKQKT